MACAMIRWSEVSVCLASRFQRRLTSHGLQVRKFCNHLVELHLLFRSKRGPSMLDLIIISILKPGKPAGSARVLICNRCHHNHNLFYAVQRYKKDLILVVLWTIIFQFLYFSSLVRPLTMTGDNDRNDRGQVPVTIIQNYLRNSWLARTIWTCKYTQAFLYSGCHKIILQIWLYLNWLHKPKRPYSLCGMERQLVVCLISLKLQDSRLSTQHAALKEIDNTLHVYFKILYFD